MLREELALDAPPAVVQPASATISARRDSDLIGRASVAGHSDKDTALQRDDKSLNGAGSSAPAQPARRRVSRRSRAPTGIPWCSEQQLPVSGAAANAKQAAGKVVVSPRGGQC